MPLRRIPGQIRQCRVRAERAAAEAEEASASREQRIRLLEVLVGARDPASLESDGRGRKLSVVRWSRSPQIEKLSEEERERILERARRELPELDRRYKKVISNLDRISRGLRPKT